MTNPLLTVTDLEAVVACGRDRDLVTVVDNTFASPVNLQALALGFDLEDTERDQVPQRP
ncbi:MAG: PLP-dependent transferase [Candidatus Poribacteria bacterium]